APFRLHLGARYASAHSRRSNHELRLEIDAADGVHLYRRGRRLALPGPRSGRLALVAGSPHNRLSHAFALPVYEQKVRAVHLSFRRINNVAFLVIPSITLSGALAAATLR